ncbi:trehalose phosphatase [Paraburkholderia sp. BR13439]|uniref:Trehalose phosphatase n=1 Tax=Paraburkholderia youngii TaxID=2782701 RepID=A0A7Y6N278_9BURK|nr:trehalose phosphatase [Paraburkholderia youngii]NUY05928.1 trehalose phosphatase [Paraburkholderia youngii]
MSSNRPLIFVDLDDTLFQTASKMADATPRIIATLDVHGQPNGYMNPVQNFFLNWLLASADVVPVTARSVEAYNRVKLPFTEGAICSHGGVMLRPDGSLDQPWHAQMAESLRTFQDRLSTLREATLQIGKELGYSLRSWVVEEKGLRHYVLTKHNESDDSVLTELLTEVQSRSMLECMHTHVNGNNLALLPAGLEKRFAVQEWLRRDREVHGERPVLGFGDSISDLGFMDLCHMWSTPARSQLATVVKELINE